MKQHTNIRLSPELLKMVKDAAKKEHRSFTNFIEVVLLEHFSKKK